ncbi:MAG: DUF1028 domain-containing protein [Planctomycetota bacterium]|jgi:uncharacterized Ntn-hydrolase superfamily protein
MAFCLLPALRRLLALLVLLCLTQALPATWSIILINIVTGEIAVGSATCLANFDLRRGTPVILVGWGAATAQSYVDSSGRNRQLILAEFTKGTAPSQILALLAKQDSIHQWRQYGIVDAKGRTLTFTGSNANAWAGGVTGKVGNIVYAIQGNLLTGAAVVTDAEKAVKNTNGDLAAKLMAGMLAARAKGGDARCSRYNKSAHVGYMIIARQGDKDGTQCNASVGCATGTYYMNLNVIAGTTAQDPVLTLQTLYNNWRKQWLGRPDHHLSTVVLPTKSLPSDGITTTTARLVLRDQAGTQLTQGGAKVTITHEKASTAQLTIGQVTDHKDGSYSFSLKGGTSVGVAWLRITVDDGKGAILLSPRTTISVTGDKLWASLAQLPVTTGGNIDFVLNQGKANGQQPYLLLASNSGTTPGIQWAPNLVFPLNPDGVFHAVAIGALNSSLPGFLGTLDAAGRKTVRLPMPPGAYLLPIHTDLHFAYGLLSPVGNFSNAVPVRLVR